MQRKHLALIIAGFLSVLLAVGLLLRASLGTSQTSQVVGSPERSVTANGTTITQGTGTRTAPAQAKMTPTPVHSLNGTLSISSIGINAPIENVGIDPTDNTLAVPTLNPWTGVGWYENGPYPGTQGSAVIDGHLDRPGGYPAVFWNLKNLKVGAIVTVTSAQGKAYHFKVTALAYYCANTGAQCHYPPPPLSAIFGNTGGTYLNLITCAGVWIPSIKQTTLRLVVYTTLI